MIQSMQLTLARLVLTAKSFKFTDALQVRVGLSNCDGSVDETKLDS